MAKRTPVAPSPTAAEVASATKAVAKMVNGTPAKHGTGIRDKFAATRREMSAALIERNEEIDLALVGLLAGEHVLLVGPPGAAKTMLIDALVEWMDCRKFSMLFTKFSTPEETSGPVSVKGLQNDRYYRVIQDMLPTADIAYFDEIFKASSAILNTLITALNERKFRNGTDGWMDIPLRTAFASSNEWAEGKELGALFDRFLLRKSVAYVSGHAGLEKLMWASDDELKPKLSTRLSAAELAQARADVLLLPFSEEAKTAARRINTELRAAGIRAGDRRVRKAPKVARAFAWLSGSDVVLPEHLDVYSHVLWDDPEEGAKKCCQIIGKIANAAAGIAVELTTDAEKVAAAANPHDPTSAITAVKAMDTIISKLEALKDTTGKVAQRIDHVRGLREDIHRAAMNRS